MAFSPQTKSRSWIATVQIANMVKAGLTKEEYENPEYVADHFINLWEDSGNGRQAAIAVCVSLEGLYHCHMALYGNTTTLKKVSDILYNSHVEPQLAGKEALRSYILKEGKYEEKGEQVLFSKGIDLIKDAQGKRNDLDEINELIDQGYSPQAIFEQNIRYRKYEKMIKSAYLNKRIKETPLMKTMHCEWHFGESGTGKSYTYIKLCEEYSEDEIYLCNDYSNAGGSSGGFDMYMDNPAKIVVLDEFRGNMPYNQLLSILDVYSRNQTHCRYQNTYNLWTSVYICSILPPELAYKSMVDDLNRKTDTFRQLMRRLDYVVYHYKYKDEFRTFKMEASKYYSASNMKYLVNEIIKVEEEKDNTVSLIDSMECSGTPASLKDFCVGIENKA